MAGRHVAEWLIEEARQGNGGEVGASADGTVIGQQSRGSTIKKAKGQKA